MMKRRLIQAGLIVACGLLINAIGWPGPHGGMQHLGQVFWHTLAGPQCALLALLAIGLCGSLVPYLPIRLLCTATCAVGLGVLYVMLLQRIHPPARPVTIATSAPALGTLVAFAVMGFFRGRAGQAGRETAMTK